MKALELGVPGGLEALQVVARPDPTPGRGEVLVRMRAVSLNYRDLLMMTGAYGAAAKPPITPFSDGCGIVEVVGEGVTRVKAGDRVSTLFFQDWISGPPTLAKLSSALGHPIPGAGRELAVFSAEGVSKVPDYLTDEEVATLPCAALTAWRGLFEDARLTPGDTVLLQGTGGVSIFGLQFAHAAGLRTIVTSSSDEKLERAKALGANEGINYRAVEAWSEPARRLTGGRGVDFVMEVGGAGTLKESLKAVRVGGHIAIVGVVAGASTPLLVPALIATSARLQGLSVGSRDMFEAMLRFMDLHRIRPVIGQTRPWTEARAALESMSRGEHFGKIVLTF